MCKEGTEKALEKGQAEDSIKAIREPLLSWFKANARDLPWRKSREPYPIWISEIMLQQTRVEAVKPYFKRFMEAFPGIPDLAGAGEEKLLKLWEGLGYYSRARNLKKAAGDWDVHCRSHRFHRLPDPGSCRGRQRYAGFIPVFGKPSGYCRSPDEKRL